MRFLKKFALGAILLLLFSNTAFAIGLNTNIGIQTYTTLEGSVNVVPIDTTYEQGSTTTRWAKMWTTDLDVSGVFTFGGMMGSNLDMDGYNLILDTDGDSAIVNDRDAGVADDEFDISLNSAVDFTFAENLFSAVSGSSVVVEDSGFNMGTTILDAGIFTMMDGAQAGDDTLTITLSGDGAGNAALTTSDGYIALDSNDDIYMRVQGGDVVIAPSSEATIGTPTVDSAGFSIDASAWDTDDAVGRDTGTRHRFVPASGAITGGTYHIDLSRDGTFVSNLYSVNSGGNFMANADIRAGSGDFETQTAGAGVRLIGRDASDGSAVATTLRSQITLNTAGDKMTSWDNNGTEVAFIDYLGALYLANANAPDLVLDNTTTGADADSGYVTWRGNDGAADTELDMSVLLDVTTTTDYKLGFYDDGKGNEIASLDESGNLQVDGAFKPGSIAIGDDAFFDRGSAPDFRSKYDTNSTADAYPIYQTTKSTADDSSAIFYSRDLDPDGDTGHNDYLSPTFVIANDEGADANDYAGVVIGERAQADVAVAHYFDFYAMTGAIDGTPDATTTELAPIFRIGDAGTATTGHSLSSGDVLFENDVEVDGNAHYDGYLHYYSGIVGYKSSNPQWQIEQQLDDGIHLALDSTDGRANHNLIITSYDNRVIDHDHETLSTNPTLIGHSALAPDNSNSEYWSKTHNGEDTQLTSGFGGFQFGVAAQPARGKITVTGDITLDETFVLNATTFTAKAADNFGADEFKRDGTVTEIATAIAGVINGGSESANAHAWNEAGIVYVEWLTKGVAGNTITFTEALTNVAFDAVTLGKEHEGVAADSVVVSITEAGKMNLDSLMSATGGVFTSTTSGVGFQLGGGGEGMGWKGITDGGTNLSLGVTGYGNNVLNITDNGNKSVDHGEDTHQTNPTVRWYSATDVDNSNSEYGSVFHSGDDMIMSVGLGGYSWDIDAQPARGTMDLTGLPVATETFVINATTVTAVAAGAGADEFNIGADADETCDNIITAVNAGTEAANVHAYAGAGDTVVFEWLTKGVAGNAIVFTEAMTNTAVDGGGNLGGTHYGVDAGILLTLDEHGSFSDLDIATANPMLSFSDTDVDDHDVSFSIDAQATDTGSGTEDIDVTFQAQVAGAMSTFLGFDADGAMTIGLPSQAIAFNTSAVSGITTLGIAGDLTNYEAVNDGNPRFNMGASATERGFMQVIYNAGTQVLNYVLFQTDAGSAAADAGQWKFNVDGTDILAIDDGGLELVGGINMSGDITTTAAIDWDLTDNTAEALSFDAVGKAGIFNIRTVDNQEGISTSGGLSVGANTSFVPSGDTAQANDSAVDCNSNTIARVVGDGAATILDTDPAISDGVSDGQICIIQGTSDANTVQIVDNVNTQLDGAAAVTLGQGDILQVVWDSGDSFWYEMSRSNN